MLLTGHANPKSAWHACIPVCIKKQMHAMPRLTPQLPMGLRLMQPAPVLLPLAPSCVVCNKACNDLSCDLMPLCTHTYITDLPSALLNAGCLLACDAALVVVAGCAVN